MGDSVKISFEDLTEDQKLFFGNGVGPEWLPDWARNVITKTASWFFKEASWRHHDFGYARGFTWQHRFEYDWKFYKAMTRDALSQSSTLKVPFALFLSVVFFGAVAAFGWSSFHFGDRYRAIDEIIRSKANSSA
jgi:hypothetical protein